MVVAHTAHIGEEVHDQTSDAPSRDQDRQATHFAFERLLDDHGAGPAAVRNMGEHEAPQQSTVRIEFKVKQSDGSLYTTNTLDVLFSNPSSVKQMATKYLRQKFLLFDVHDNNLTARTCFAHITSDRSNIVVLKAVPGGTDLVEIQGRTRTDKS